MIGFGKCAAVAGAVAASLAFAGETVVFELPNGPSVDKRFMTARPEQCMPFGAGNLSAMVAFGKNALELHLSRADYVLGGDLPSPGHVTVRFPDLELAGFRQVMDVERGEVRLTLPCAGGRVEVVCSGDRASGALVVELDDTRRNAASPVVSYSCGRAGNGRFGSALSGDGGSWAALAESDPNSGRHYETRAELKGGRLVIASATARDAASAKAKAREAVAAAGAARKAELESRRLAWWKDFWSRGDITLTGDERAEKLAKYWKINLYAWANVGFGELPPKFNGGPGLVFGDSRHWGAGFLWQNTRGLIWPMCAAGHPEFAKSSLDVYEAMRPGLAEGYLPETVGLERHPISGMRPEVDPGFVENRAKVPATFTSHVFSSGAEYVQQLVEYMRWTGDRTLEPVLAQWTRLMAGLYLRLVEKGPDGKWHVKCTNVNESWWKVDDSLVDLCAARFVFAMVVAHGSEWSIPAALVAAARERLDNLATVPTADTFTIPPISPTNDYEMVVRGVVQGDRRFVPTPLRDGILKRAYAPNEIYIVYPFAMIDAASDCADRNRAIEAYRGLCRECDFVGGDGYYLGYWGWDHLGVAAVRLGLPEAADEVWKHVFRTMRWPFGGAKSPAGVMYPGCEVEDAPYFDGAGVMMTELQEMLLQSHAIEPDPNLFGGGVIKLLPCVPKSWSGSYRLHARGGFIVECAFGRGTVTRARITATRAAPLAYRDPFTGRVERRTLSAGESATFCKNRVEICW